SLRAGILGESVPLVDSRPSVAQPSCCRVILIFNVDRGPLQRSVTNELRSKQCVGIPAPFILSVASGIVNPDPSTSILDPTLERSFLLITQDIPAGVIPYNNLE